MSSSEEETDSGSESEEDFSSEEEVDSPRALTGNDDDDGQGPQLLYPPDPPAHKIRSICCHMDDILLRLGNLFPIETPVPPTASPRAVDFVQLGLNNIAGSAQNKSPRSIRSSHTQSARSARSRINSPRSARSRRSESGQTGTPNRIPSEGVQRLHDPARDGSTSARSKRQSLSLPFKDSRTPVENDARVGSERHTSIYSAAKLDRQVGFKKAVNELKMMAILSKKRKQPSVQEVDVDQEEKVEGSSFRPNSKLRLLLQQKRGVLKMIQKVGGGDTHIDAHTQKLRDMEELLRAQVQTMEDEKAALVRKLDDALKAPAHLREEHEQKIKKMQDLLERKLQDAEEEKKRVEETLKSEQEAVMAVQKEELATKYLKELHEKEEKLAQREAALEKEKLQVEDQINSIKSNSRDEALHKEGLARLHEKLKNREKDMATRRDQISLDIAKQTEVTRKAKKFRLRSAGAIGKFLRLQTKSSAWNKLKEEAEEKRLRSEAEQKVREDIVEHHREHMEAIGEDEDETGFDPFQDAINGRGDESMPSYDPFQEVVGGGGDESMPSQEIVLPPPEVLAKMDEHREAAFRQKEKNAAERKKIGEKMAATQKMAKTSMDEHKNIEEQLIAVETKLEETSSADDQRELTALHASLLENQERHEEQINSHKEKMSKLHEHHKILESEHATKFARPIEKLRGALNGKLRVVGKMAMFRQKAARQIEFDKISKIRDLHENMKRSKEKVAKLQVMAVQIAERSVNPDLDEISKAKLADQAESIAKEKAEEERQLKQSEEEKTVEEFELEQIEHEREVKDSLPLRRLRTLIVSNRHTVKMMSDMTSEREKNKKALEEMKAALGLHEATLEQERQQIKARYEDAIRLKDMAMQSKLSNIQHDLDEKEAALDRKQEALEMEVRIDQEETAAAAKDDALRGNIERIEAQLEQILKEDEMLEGRRSKLRKDAILAARLGGNQKPNPANLKEEREISKKRKKGLEIKLNLEKALSREIQNLKLRRERETSTLNAEITSLEEIMAADHVSLEEMGTQLDFADDDDERKDLQVRMETLAGEMKVREIRLLSLRGRLIRTQNQGHVEATMHGSGKDARAALRKIDEAQDKLNAGEIELEKLNADIDAAKRELDQLPENARPTSSARLKHMNNERDELVEKIEIERAELEKLIHESLCATDEALHSINENTSKLKFSKKKEDLLALLHHIEEKEEILDEEEEIIRLDRLDAVSRNMPVERYDDRKISIAARREAFAQEKNAVEIEMQELVDAYEKVDSAKLARKQAKSEMEASKTVTEKMNKALEINIRNLEIRHVNLVQEESDLDQQEKDALVASKNVLSLPEDKRVMEEQRIASIILDVHEKRGRLRAEKDDVDAKAAKMLASIDATGMAILVHQKENVLSTFMRSLDHENFILSEREAALRHDHDNVNSELKLKELLPSRKKLLKNRAEAIELELFGIEESKRRIHDQTEHALALAAEQRKITEHARLEAADEADRAQVDRLYVDIDAMMKTFQTSFDTSVELEFTKRELSISRSSKALLNDIGDAADNMKLVNDMSVEVFDLVSEVDAKKNLKRHTHSQQMLELHAAAEEAKDQLYQKLAKMKNQRRILLAQLNANKTNAGTTEEKQVLESLNAQALKLDGTIKNCDVDLHRIELDVREAAREKRKEMREFEGKLNQKVLIGLDSADHGIHDVADRIQKQKIALRSAREDMESCVQAELAEAVESLLKQHAKRLSEEELAIAAEEKSNASEDAHINDLLSDAADGEKAELLKRLANLNEQRVALAAKQAGLTKLRLSSEQSINDQKAKFEKSIRDQYEDDLKKKEDDIKRAESMLEMEQKKINQKRKTRHTMDESLVKHMNLDISEAERDHKGAEVAKNLETANPMDIEKIKTLTAEMNSVHKSSDDLNKDRTNLENNQEEEHFDIAMEEENTEEVVFEMDDGGDEAMAPRHDSLNLHQLNPVTSKEQIQALEDVQQEVVKIENKKSINQEEILKLKQERAEEEAKLEELEAEDESKLAEDGITDAEDDVSKANKLEKAEQLQSRIKYLTTKVQEALIGHAKLDKQAAEFAAVKKELEENKKMIDRLKTTHAATKWKLSKKGPTPAVLKNIVKKIFDIVDPMHDGKITRRHFLKAVQQNGEVQRLLQEHPALKPLNNAKLVAMRYEEMDLNHDGSVTVQEMIDFATDSLSKTLGGTGEVSSAVLEKEVLHAAVLEKEKKQSLDKESEYIAQADDSRKRELDKLEAERQNIENLRADAAGKIKQIEAEKESQQELVDQNQASKASLKKLMLKHMGHLKVIETFDMQLQTLKAKEVKIAADHAAAIAKAAAERKQYIAGIVGRHKKSLSRLALIDAERRRISQLEMKLQGDKAAKDAATASARKNRFSNLLKKHKEEISLTTKAAKKDMQMDALKEGMRSARERLAQDRADAAQLQAELKAAKLKYERRSWIRKPEKTEVLAATKVQAFHRGCRSRADMPRYRLEKAKHDAKRSTAAIKIQSAYRGHVGREKAKFRQKLADMGMVYQWKRGPSEEEEKEKSVGVNTEAQIMSTAQETEFPKQLLLQSGSGTLARHPGPGRGLVQVDSLMSTARSEYSDWSDDSMASLGRPPQKSSADLYQHTDTENRRSLLPSAKESSNDREKAVSAMQTTSSIPSIDPYSNMFPANREDLINQAIGILVGNEQKGVSGRNNRRNRR